MGLNSCSYTDIVQSTTDGAFKQAKPFSVFTVPQLTTCIIHSDSTGLLTQLMAAALLVLLLLLAVPLTAFTTTDVYYVTADDAEQSCPPHQICHNLSYYISQQDSSFFTSDTTVIFLEGEHSFDREYLVYVSNASNLNFERDKVSGR